MKRTDVVCIGAGPAGLTASYLLSKKAIPCVVLEADPRHVGGISRTIVQDGFRFDIGGHRFFSKSPEINALWSELLPRDLLERERTSRIYYRGKLFSYPLDGWDALGKLGVIEAARCALSYLVASLFPVKNPKTFEDWVTNQFGKRLFAIFFKTYTEKVWGMSCKEISADWAAQRIAGLSLASAIWNALRPRKSSAIKTIIRSFKYPRQGPGMMWEAAATKTRALGGEVRLGCRVTGLLFERGRWIVRFQSSSGQAEEIESSHVISSAPLRELMSCIEPRPETAGLARKLRYRDFILVAVMLRERRMLEDQWIYIHDPSVKVGRIQNYKRWSPEMVPDPSLCCYGMEYFCFENDNLWQKSDEELLELAKRELEKLGLARAEDVLGGHVVRQEKAYPVYDDGYMGVVDRIRHEIDKHYPGLHLVGRNGMHKYNNQDHAMMTAMLTVENIASARRVYDVWQVNQDAAYHESEGATGERMVPARL
jgi:protoporphyrinogen oxidase